MADRHDIMWFDTLDSTNEEVRRRIDSLDNLSVVSALSQTAGRGQRGNSWSSAPGENLTFSVLLRFASDDSSCFSLLKATDQFVISEIAALSVVQFLENHGISASIKWPNDIYIVRKKVCGILVENILRGSGVFYSIVGIGLNVNQRNFDVTLSNPTSMLLEIGEQVCFPDYESDTYNIRCLLDEFMVIFAEKCNVYLVSLPDHSKLRDSFISHLWRLNEPARYLDFTALPAGHASDPIVAGRNYDEAREFTGIIRGLSPIGNLLVEDIKANSIKEFAFKEISYIL